MEQLIALRLGSKDLHNLSYLHPSLRSNGFWIRKFYAAYGTGPENSNDYMLEYLVMEKLDNSRLYSYLLENRYNNLFKRLVNRGHNIDFLFTRAVEYSNLEIIKYLVEQGAYIHVWNDAALRLAAHNGHLEVVKYLVEQGADINAWNGAALRYTAGKGHLEVLKYLVEQGADIHVQDDHALRYAAENGHLEVVKYLVEKGADINAQNGEPLRWAAQNGHLEVLKYLLEKGADIHAGNDAALRNAALNGSLEAVKYLVEKGAGIHANYDYVLRWAGTNSNSEIMHYLQERIGVKPVAPDSINGDQTHHQEIHKFHRKKKVPEDSKHSSKKERCAAITLKGDQCKKNAVNGKYCSVHSKNK